MGSFKNKTVLITGASSGIGEDFARILSQKAAGIILVARRKDRLEKLAAELLRANPTLKVTVETCDLSLLEDVQKLTERLDPSSIDILVNNAGLGDARFFEQSDFSKQKQMIDVNITAVVKLSHWILPALIKKKSGGIINISSSFGLMTLPGFATYIGTKHFVSGFTESLDGELAGTGVQALHVCPGPVATEFEIQAGRENLKSTSTKGSLLEKTKNFKGGHQSSHACAAESILAYEMGFTRLVPSFKMKVLIFVGGFIPKFVYRITMRPVGRIMRHLASTG